MCQLKFNPIKSKHDVLTYQKTTAMDQKTQKNYEYDGASDMSKLDRFGSCLFVAADGSTDLDLIWS